MRASEESLEEDGPELEEVRALVHLQLHLDGVHGVNSDPSHQPCDAAAPELFKVALPAALFFLL